MRDYLFRTVLYVYMLKSIPYEPSEYAEFAEMTYTHTHLSFNKT